MGQCYGKTNPTPENDNTTATVAGPGDLPLSPAPSSTAGTGNGFPSVKGTPARSSSAASPWPSPYPQGGGVTPSPARGTPRRFFRRPFPPPSPAKHIRASLANVGSREDAEGRADTGGGAGGGGDAR
ncbi:hypothetical protein SESBI_23660 [Sesbania bispinosa]|nr:hypothetical protein SESBI_23660 [Sesbania bispinosa]